MTIFLKYTTTPSPPRAASPHPQLQKFRYSLQWLEGSGSVGSWSSICRKLWRGDSAYRAPPLMTIPRAVTRYRSHTVNCLGQNGSLGAHLQETGLGDAHWAWEDLLSFLPASDLQRPPSGPWGRELTYKASPVEWQDYGDLRLALLLVLVGSRCKGNRWHAQAEWLFFSLSANSLLPSNLCEY